MRYDEGSDMSTLPFPRSSSNVGDADPVEPYSLDKFKVSSFNPDVHLLPSDIRGSNPKF